MRCGWLLVVLGAACTCKKAEPSAAVVVVQVAPPSVPAPPPPALPPSRAADCPSRRQTHTRNGKPAFIWEEVRKLEPGHEGEQACVEQGFSLLELNGDALASFSPRATLSDDERFVIDVAGISCCYVFSGEVMVYDTVRRALVLNEVIGDPRGTADSLAGVLRGLGIYRIGDSDSPRQALTVTPVAGAPLKFTVEVTAIAQPERDAPNEGDVKVEHALIDLHCAEKVVKCKATLRSHEASTAQFIDRVCD